MPALIGWLLGSPWSWVSPWSYAGLVMISGLLCLGLAPLVAGASRTLLSEWHGVDIPDGYHPRPELVQLATGYWWNGHTYERSRRDAEMDQRRRRFAEPAYWRDVRWVVVAACTVGIVCAAPFAVLATSIVALAHPSPSHAVIALGLIAAGLVAGRFAWRILGPVGDRWLRLSERAALAGRVRRLEVERADQTMAHAAEIRRIERDLHDGAQARLVAVGLSLAVVERLMDTDPAQAKAVLSEARSDTSASLAGLRELVRGVYPPVLVERGLVEAIRALALDTPMTVHVTGEIGRRLESPIESALYFGVSELIANAAKYARFAEVQIVIVQGEGCLVLYVEDDGPGGATVTSGGGLDGIRRRLAAFGGTLAVDSPGGGPTVVRMELPCG
ncbi:sensor histidine kinase [Rhodococcus sp. ACT016]|uniref:sensor histidine kinase n=1 Tax=Rhodococcus sp. ACT016 TaxID=3134808 RepID=UPI003D2989D3